MLGLLAAHFKVDQATARYLFQLAGYDPNQNEIVFFSDDQLTNKGAKVDDDNPSENKKREIKISLAPDNKILYSDMVQVMSNQYGVVLNFLQLAPGNQAQVVSRVGMSREHLQSLIDLLQKNLDSLDQ